MSTPKQFAEKLLQIKALQINLQKPYTWASGWHSPVYCDNRKVLSFPYTRDFVKSELCVRHTRLAEVGGWGIVQSPDFPLISQGL